MTQETNLDDPWTLHFDRDGTEDYGIIRDAHGQDIAASHLPSTRIGDRTIHTGTFWLPESDEDEMPVLVRQLQLMTAAPRLLAALKRLLDAVGGLPIRLLSGPIYDAFNQAKAAIVAAEAGGEVFAASREPMVIEVRGGVVQEVRNVPPGFAYRILDHDDREEDDTPAVLPPDPDGLNHDRASWAARAVTAFQGATGTDDEDVLCDLLVDLMHWSDRHRYDFEAALVRGRGHYSAETGNEDRPF